jgi:hypothetical protein
MRPRDSPRRKRWRASTTTRCAFDAAGRFAISVGGERPASGDWLRLPEGASAIWVRHFYEDVRREALGSCAIEALDGAPPPPWIEPERFARRLARLGPTLARVGAAWAAVEADERARPNQVRHWSEMQGGAAFTEPGIHYLRGAWQLAPGEALVLEGTAVACRYWNALLYSRFLNSLDHRHRQVSLTGSRVALRDGRYRLVLAAEDPGLGNWLDTECRACSMPSPTPASCICIASMFGLDARALRERSRATSCASACANGPDGDSRSMIGPWNSPRRAGRKPRRGHHRRDHSRASVTASPAAIRAGTLGGVRH